MIRKITFFREYCDWIHDDGDNAEVFKKRSIALLDYAFNGNDSDIIPDHIKQMIDNDVKRIGRFTPDYKHWRNAVFERDKYTCAICHKVGGVLNAHHIKPYAYYPELRYDVDNGVTLCAECHREVHRSERQRSDV